MEQQTFVYGYIETDPHRDADNIEALRRHRFSKTERFTNIFSRPRRGHRASVISFAGVFKDLNGHWPHWQQRFERLLGRLHARTARIHVNNDLTAELCCITYVCDDDWDDNAATHIRGRGKQRWIKSVIVNGGSHESMML